MRGRSAAVILAILTLSASTHRSGRPAARRDSRARRRVCAGLRRALLERRERRALHPECGQHRHRRRQPFAARGRVWRIRRRCEDPPRAGLGLPAREDARCGNLDSVQGRLRSGRQAGAESRRSTHEAFSAAARDGDSDKPSASSARARATTSDSTGQSIFRSWRSRRCVRRISRGSHSSAAARTNRIGPGVFVIEYREHATPTIITGLLGRDMFAHGRLWIEAATGRIVRTELPRGRRALAGLNRDPIPPR